MHAPPRCGQAGEDAAISFYRASPVLNVHRPDVINSHVRERWFRDVSAFFRQISHHLLHWLAVVFLALYKAVQNRLDSAVVFQNVIFTYHL